MDLVPLTQSEFWTNTNYAKSNVLNTLRNRSKRYGSFQEEGTTLLERYANGPWSAPWGWADHEQGTTWAPREPQGLDVSGRLPLGKGTERKPLPIQFPDFSGLEEWGREWEAPGKEKLLGQRDRDKNGHHVVRAGGWDQLAGSFPCWAQEFRQLGFELGNYVLRAGFKGD